MMRLHNLGLSAFVCLLVVFSTSWVPNLSMVFTVSQVLAQTENQRKTEADRLHNQGLQQLETSQFEAALQSFQQALKIYQEIKDRKNEIAALGNIGNAYLSLGNYPKAIDYNQQGLAIAREIKYPKDEAISLGNLGIAYLSLGDYPKAIEYHRQSLAIARKAKILNNEGSALSNRRARAFVELISSRLANGNTEAKSPEPPTITEIKQIAKAQNATLVQYSIIYDEFKVPGNKQHEKTSPPSPLLAKATVYTQVGKTSPLLLATLKSFPLLGKATVYTQVIESLPVLELPHPNPPRMYWGGN
jgi:tetratricopeptide (TPR) repeat protein